MINNFELSQSALKDWLKTENKEEWYKHWVLKQRKYEYNTSFIYGSLLDSFLFDQEALKRNFITYRGTCKPSEALQGVIGLVAKKYDKNLSKQEQFLSASRELKYGDRWKDDTVLKRFEGLDDYIDFCIENRRKTVIMYDYAKMIQDIANYLVYHTDSDIYQYIVKEPSEDYRNEFQVTLKGTIENVPCKVIIDILHYDELNSICRLVDFKTSYEVQRFIDNIENYGYDTQVSFYQDILKQNPHMYEGYTLLEPLNIVVAKRDHTDIHVHNYLTHELGLCKYGDPLINKKGWLEVVGEISEYLNSLK